MVRPSLTHEEIARSFSGAEYPPVLTVDQAARLAAVSKSTIYHRVSKGMYRSAVRRGKPLLFFRDRFVRAEFNR